MLNKHQANYKPDAWRENTVEELEWWVKLLRKRAGHRVDGDKKTKDYRDAENYSLMLNKARLA